MMRDELLGHLRRQAQYDHKARVLLALHERYTPQQLAMKRAAAIEAYRRRDEAAKVKVGELLE